MSKPAPFGFGRHKTQDGTVLPKSQLLIPMPKVTPPPPAKPPARAGGENKARG